MLDGVVTTHPIAGTRWRGATEEEDIALEKDLRTDEKERAEHVMLVDLGRNDLGRVCEPGTVKVRSFFSVERYSHVMHLVSTVTGLLRRDRNAFDAVTACFPAGTLSGAPKPRAMEIIEELEPTRRGLYGGIVGYLDFAGNADTAIAIRTALVRDGVAYVQAGGGIVADSDPVAEDTECLNKARAVLCAVATATTLRVRGGGAGRVIATACPRTCGTWSPGAPRRTARRRCGALARRRLWWARGGRGLLWGASALGLGLARAAARGSGAPAGRGRTAPCRADGRRAAGARRGRGPRRDVGCAAARSSVGCWVSSAAWWSWRRRPRCSPCRWPSVRGRCSPCAAACCWRWSAPPCSSASRSCVGSAPATPPRAARTAHADPDRAAWAALDEGRDPTAEPPADPAVAPARRRPPPTATDGTTPPRRCRRPMPAADLG